MKIVKLCDCYYCHYGVYDDADNNVYFDEEHGYIHRSCAVKYNRADKGVSESEVKS